MLQYPFSFFLLLSLRSLPVQGYSEATNDTTRTTTILKLGALRLSVCLSVCPAD